ncbi:MAG: two-component system, LytT family, response regulator [Bacteroidetes bacterium]|nr:MAG: two-component system, LytT family, response regulator [Bacteroidota bacterium]
MSKRRKGTAVKSANLPLDQNKARKKKKSREGPSFVSMEIRSILVEDEFKVRQVLVDLLGRFCPEVKVLAEASNIDEATEQIERLKPDLVFLDIEMPGGNGFELLARFRNPDFKTIFVTSYGHYAIRAIRFSALDYLLKPVMIEDLQQAVERARARISAPEQKQQYELLTENLAEKKTPAKLMLNNKSKLEYIETKDITYLEGDGNYTNIHLSGGRRHCLSRTLREFEEMLCEAGSDFVRIHKGYIVNMLYVKHIERGERFALLLKDDTRLEVSRRKKPELLERLQAVVH